jgi:hypothetical protein
MSRIGYILLILRLIPHVLARELKQVCLAMCLQLLPKLGAHAHDNWRYLVSGAKAGSTMNIFETEYGQHEMKTRLKWRTGSLRPEKVC